MKEVIFIGGPVDGERHEVRSGKASVQINVLIKTPEYRDVDRVKRYSQTQETYRVEHLSGPKSIFPVCVHQDVDLDEALSMLLKGYKP